MTHIAGLTSTYSKHPNNFPPNFPHRLSRAYGAHVWDHTGKRYTDWSGCLGANILGHGHAGVTDAIREQLQNGIVFPLPTALEEDVAQMICAATNTEQVRFCKNGSDATEAAVRLARHVTGRTRIVTTGYHGSHSDVVAATAGKSGGVLKAAQAAVHAATTSEQLMGLVQSGDIAAILAEPIFADGTDWPWAKIQKRCQDSGTLLIFDEVICGFRYLYGSASTTLPDLFCFGKAIANGMPLACIAGPERYLRLFEKEVFFSSTAAAECLSLAACRATLRAMQDERAHGKIRSVGQYFLDECKRLHLPYVGLPPRSQFRFSSDEQRNAFLAGMCERGHLFTRDNFITAAHTQEDVDDFAKRAVEVLDELS